MRKLREFLDKIIGYHKDCICEDIESWDYWDDGAECHRTARSKRIAQGIQGEEVSETITLKIHQAFSSSIGAKDMPRKSLILLNKWRRRCSRRVLQYYQMPFQKVTSTIATDLLAPQVEIIAYAYYTSRAYEFAS
jgi:hypothetical protein